MEQRKKQESNLVPLHNGLYAKVVDPNYFSKFCKKENTKANCLKMDHQSQSLEFFHIHSKSNH